MGERAKVIINEYSALEILKRTDFDLSKFYSSDYKIFINALLKENKQLQSQLQQKENIIKEVREYIEHENFKRTILVGVSTKKYTKDILNKILEILDKENK